jgi:hypothetical protein
LDTVIINLPSWPGTKRTSETDAPEVPEIWRVLREVDKPLIHRWARRQPFMVCWTRFWVDRASRAMSGKGKPLLMTWNLHALVQTMRRVVISQIRLQLWEGRKSFIVKSLDQWWPTYLRQA